MFCIIQKRFNPEGNCIIFMDRLAILDELVTMSQNIARPEMDCVILGEGNTSARIDEESFYVKGSGQYMAKVGREGYVEILFEPALAVLDGPDLTDDEIKEALFACRKDKSGTLKPSVETILHAFLLTLPGVNFVAHTHPTAVNMILCSKKAEEVYSGRIFPDEIVYCGIEPLYIGFVDPGIPLARALRQKVNEYIEKHNIPPKVILIQNHGFIALGSNAHECEAITAMGVKTARVLAGTYIFGGPKYFTEENVKRIYTRPDEAYRRSQFAK